MQTLDADFLEEIENLRVAGDLMADELTRLQHTTGLSRSGAAALDAWDPLSFPMHRKIQELSKVVA